MSTYSEKRRAALAEILRDKSIPWETRFETLARFVESELGRAFARGARAARMGGESGRAADRAEARVVEVGDDL